MGNVRRREERECHICRIRWCSLDHRWANRRTCSEECRHRLSGITQTDPTARWSKYRSPMAGPRLVDVAAAAGLSVASVRGVLGGQARMRKLTKEQRRAMGRKGGKKSARSVDPDVRRAISRRAAAVTNHKRWGTPLLEGHHG